MPAAFGDGWDCYAAPADAIVGHWDSGTVGFTLVAGRFAGSQAIQNSANSAWLVKTTTGTSDSNHHISCAFQQTAAITGTTLGMYLQLSDGATNQVCIVFRSDGAILLTSATPAGTVLATYTGAVTAASTWYQFEFEVVIHNSAGSFSVRKLGNTSNDFSASSLNTRPGANAQASKLTVGQQATVTSQQMDDLLWRSDTTALSFSGDTRCSTRRPASDAAVQWTPSGVSGISQSYPASGTTSGATANMRCTLFTTYSGTISGASMAVTGSGTGNMKCAIYADNSGAPGSVLATATTPVASPVSGGVSFTFSPALSVTVGTRVWLAFQNDSGAPTWGGTAIGNTLGLQIASTYASFPQPNPAPITSGVVGLNSALTYSGLSGNSGCVSEQQQDGATSYVYSSTVGQADLYRVSAITSTPASTVMVVTRAYCQKSDAGTRTLSVQLKSGSTTVSSTPAVALNTVFGWISRVDTVDPATGAAWTPTGVNNVQVGVVVVA